MTIINQSKINYQSVYPNGQIIDQTLDSNVVTTDVITYLFTKIKSTIKNILSEGEITTQTVVLTNTSNYVLSNILFKDLMTEGAEYVVQSVTINGVSFLDFDVKTGFSLPSINPNEIVTITYNIQANSPKTLSPVQNFATIDYTVQDPIIGPVNFSENTNTISIDIVSTSINIVKSVNKTNAYAGDVLHFSNIISNSGSTSLNNIMFNDNLDVNLNFITNSVKINGITQLGLNPNFGFVLPSLNSGQNHLVEFDVLVKNGIIKKTINNVSLLTVDEQVTPSNNVTINILERTINNPPVSIIIKDDCCRCNRCKCCLFNLCNIFRKCNK